MKKAKDILRLIFCLFFILASLNLQLYSRRCGNIEMVGHQYSYQRPRR